MTWHFEYMKESQWDLGRDSEMSTRQRPLVGLGMKCKDIWLSPENNKKTLKGFKQRTVIILFFQFWVRWANHFAAAQNSFENSQMDARKLRRELFQ